MDFWKDAKDRLDEGLEAAKKGYSFLADKTKKGASAARIQVDIKVEESKQGRLYADLGKRVFELMNNGISDMSNDANIKDAIEAIKKSDDRILKLKEDSKKV